MGFVLFVYEVKGRRGGNYYFIVVWLGQKLEYLELFLSTGNQRGVKNMMSSMCSSSFPEVVIRSRARAGSM